MVIILSFFVGCKTVKKVQEKEVIVYRDSFIYKTEVLHDSTYVSDSISIQEKKGENGLVDTFIIERFRTKYVEKYIFKKDSSSIEQNETVKQAESTIKIRIPFWVWIVVAVVVIVTVLAKLRAK